MLKALRALTYFVLILASIDSFSQESLLGGGCEVNFDLFGADTLCSNSAPIELPPVLPFGGVYSGEGVTGIMFDPSIGPGAYSLTYTYTDEFCTASSSVIMTVIQGSELDVVGDFEICSGESTTLSSSNGLELTWESGAKSVSLEYSPVSTVTSFASGPNNEGCTVLTYFTITVGEMPNASVTGETAVCLGDTTYLSIVGANSWMWANGSVEDTIQVIIYAEQTYEVTAFGIGGCDTTISVLVSVLPFPVLLVEVEASICAGDSFHVFCTGGVTYKSFLGFFDSTFSYMPEYSNSYFITAYNEIGCSATTQIFVDVRDSVEIFLSYDEEICSGETEILSVEGTENYVWTDLSEDVVLASGEAFELEISPLQTTDYKVTGISSELCFDSILFTVVVHPLPDLFISELGPICEGETSFLLAEGATDYLWNETDASNPYEFEAIDNDAVSLGGVSEFGCQSEITFYVVAHPIPVASITGTSIICEGESSILHASGATTYAWSTGEETEDIVVYPVNDSVFVVTATTEFGCADFTIFTVIVKQAPNIFLEGTDTICAGQVAHVEVESDGAFNWSVGGSEDFVDLTLTEDSTISVTATALNACSFTAYFDITVNQLPQIFLSGDNELCFGESTTITASGTPQFMWSTGSEDDQIIVTPITTTNYYATGTDINNCQIEVPYLVVVHQLPYVYFGFNVDTICGLGPILTWQANPSDGIYSGNGVSNNQFVPEDAETGWNEISYTFTDANNCVATSSDQLYVDDCTGVGEIIGNDLNVFPNPSNDYINIVCECEDAVGIRLINYFGEIVLEENGLSGFRQFVMSVSALASGIYELEIKSQSGESMYHKILVQ